MTLLVMVVEFCFWKKMLVFVLQQQNLDWKGNLIFLGTSLFSCLPCHVFKRVFVCLNKINLRNSCTWCPSESFSTACVLVFLSSCGNGVFFCLNQNAEPCIVPVNFINYFWEIFVMFRALLTTTIPVHISRNNKLIFNI